MFFPEMFSFLTFLAFPRVLFSFIDRTPTDFRHDEKKPATQ